MVDNPVLVVNETDVDQSIDICITAQLTAEGLDRSAAVTLSLSPGVGTNNFGLAYFYIFFCA